MLLKWLGVRIVSTTNMNNLTELYIATEIEKRVGYSAKQPIIAVMVKGSVTMADILIIGGIVVAIILLFASLMVMASREGEQDDD
jgi:hypothetical protein